LRVAIKRHSGTWLSTFKFKDRTTGHEEKGKGRPTQTICSSMNSH